MLPLTQFHKRKDDELLKILEFKEASEEFNKTHVLRYSSFGKIILSVYLHRIPQRRFIMMTKLLFLWVFWRLNLIWRLQWCVLVKPRSRHQSPKFLMFSVANAISIHPWSKVKKFHYQAWNYQIENFLNQLLSLDNLYSIGGIKRNNMNHKLTENL